MVRESNAKLCNTKNPPEDEGEEEETTTTEQLKQPKYLTSTHLWSAPDYQ